jgi:hypothetical protein
VYLAKLPSNVSVKTGDRRLISRIGYALVIREVLFQGMQYAFVH